MQKSKIDQFVFHNSNYKSLIMRVSELADFVNETNSFKTLFFVDKKQKEVIINYLNHYEFVEVNFQSNIINSEYEYAYLYSSKDHKKINSFISLVQVEYKNKFISLNHQDILGALMNLKIERHYLGDIVCVDNNLFFEISNHLLEYVISNIEYINKTKVVLKVIDENIIKKQEYQTYQTTIQSLRLDIIVSAIINLSRQKTKEYILQDNVKVNQIIESNISCLIENNDILSLKGYGRFLIECDVNKTNKKNKYLLYYHKYI